MTDSESIAKVVFLALGDSLLIHLLYAYALGLFPRMLPSNLCVVHGKHVE